MNLFIILSPFGSVLWLRKSLIFTPMKSLSMSLNKFLISRLKLHQFQLILIPSWSKKKYLKRSKKLTNSKPKNHKSSINWLYWTTRYLVPNDNQPIPKAKSIFRWMYLGSVPKTINKSKTIMPKSSSFPNRNINNLCSKLLNSVHKDKGTGWIWKKKNNKRWKNKKRNRCSLKLKR